jgi:hypothetical protein
MVLCTMVWALLAGLGADAWLRSGGRDPRWRRTLMLLFTLLLIISLSAAVFVGAGADRFRSLLRADLPFEWHSQVVAPLMTAAVTGAVIFAVGVLLLILIVRGPLAARVGAWIAMVMAVGELVLVHWQPQPLAPRQLYTWRPAVLDHVAPQGYSRLYVYDYSMRAYEGQDQGRSWGYSLARTPVGWSAEAARALGIQLYLNPPTGERWGIYGSYDLDLLGLFPSGRRELTVLLRQVEGTAAHLRLLQLGAVSRAMGLHSSRWWNGLSPLASDEGLFSEPIRVFVVPEPLPRAYVVGGVRVADGTDALTVLQDRSFHPEREVILARGEPKAAPLASVGTAHLETLSPDHVRIAAVLDEPGYVVLVDGYDAGWKATVDGHDAAVLRANVAFRAVFVPAGVHRVELRYRPAPVLAGIGLSSATVLVCLGLFWRDFAADS